MVGECKGRALRHECCDAVADMWYCAEGHGVSKRSDGDRCQACDTIAELRALKDTASDSLHKMTETYQKREEWFRAEAARLRERERRIRSAIDFNGTMPNDHRCLLAIISILDTASAADVAALAGPAEPCAT